MLRFLPDLPANGTVLCLGAHSDDIEIGCSGLLMQLHAQCPGLRFVWVVFSGDERRAAETRAASQRLMHGADLTLITHTFRISYFPHEGVTIKDTFESLRSKFTPDLILTHRLDDRHQDHRVLAELTWNTFRHHAILEYEIPKYEGDLGHPNIYCPLAESVVDRKVSTLLDCFPSQRGAQWFDADLFRGHMRLRGIECASPTRFAEAFHGRKLTL